MNRSTGQRLAGPYSAPGFKPKIGCVIFSSPNFFFAASISSGVTNNCGGSGSGFAPSAAARCRYSWIWWAVAGRWEMGAGRWEISFLNFGHGTFPHFHGVGSWRDSVASGKNSATAAHGRCAAGFRRARFQSPNAASWAAPAPDQIFPARSFWPTTKTFSPGANEIDFVHWPGDASTNPAIFPA